MSRVSIDKDLLDGLANSIGGKFDEDTPLTVTEQKAIIDGITKRSSTDLSASGATVTAPAGYYGSSATKTVASGTEGTPTATKGTVSNHQVSVTPSVTNTAGYISGSTKTGTSVTVTASELASGNKEITQNGTGIDVVGYSTVSIAVPSDVYLLHYGFETWGGPVTFVESYADTKAAIQNGKAVIFMAGGVLQAGVIEGVSTTSFTFDGITFSEGIRLYVSAYANPDEMFQVAWGYVNGSITTHCVQIGTAVPTGTISITTNGTVNVSAYEYANVSVSGGSTPDGNDYYYGTNPEITPYVGYGEVDSAVLR